MATYFIRTPLPLAEENRAAFAQCHHESTGNALSVLPNAAGTECLVKVNCDHSIEEVLPAGFVPTAVLTDLDEVRALLGSEQWAGEK